MNELPVRHAALAAFDVESVRREFPIFTAARPHDRRLAFLDSAASAQKPAAVIARIARFYETEYANIHRGIYTLSAQATESFEAVRDQVRHFLAAPAREEIIFTRGTTESINLIARCFARAFMRRGDAILLTEIEHHSNIVPWQMVAQEYGLEIRVARVDEAGALDVADFTAKLADGRVKIAAFTHVSNALGSILPVAELAALAHEAGAKVLVDGAQAVPHMDVDVAALDVDFYAFSAHKLFGPTGVGVLYGRRALLEAMPPWQGGGDMIDEVSFAGTTWADLPHKFEAGTPNIAGVIGFGAALDWLAGIDRAAAAAHEHRLHAEMERALKQIPGLRIIGEADGKAPLTSFVMEGAHPHDIATILDREGVAVRAGHHCAQPAMARFGVPGTVRASLALYNTDEDIAQLVEGLRKVQKIFG